MPRDECHGKSKDPALPLQRDHPLDDGLLGGLHERDQHQVQPDPQDIEPGPLPQREQRTEHSHGRHRNQQGPQRIGAEPELADQGPASPLALDGAPAQ